MSSKILRYSYPFSPQRMVVPVNHDWGVEEGPGATHICKYPTCVHLSNSAETHMKNFTIVMHILQVNKLKSYNQEVVETKYESRQVYSRALTLKHFVFDSLFAVFVSCDYHILVNRTRVDQLWTNFAEQDFITVELWCTAQRPHTDIGFYI